MSRLLKIDLPEEVDRALQEEAARTGKSPEQVALEWIEDHVETLSRGGREALMAMFGGWSMTAEERAQIEQMIEEERLLQERE
jgi:hypothetical protein